MMLDFNGSTTPILLCENRRVTDFNRSAKRELLNLRLGSVIDTEISEGLCETKFGKCIAVQNGEKFYLIYCDFFKFADTAPKYKTAENKICESGDKILRAATAESDSCISVSRLRKIILNRFSGSFYYLDTLKIYRSSVFVRDYLKVVDKTLSRIGAHLIFNAGVISDNKFINARNAAILLTQFSSMFLLYSRSGTIKVTAFELSDALGFTVSTTLKTPIPYVKSELDPIKLSSFFPAYAVDLCCAELCITSCGHTFSFDSNGAGEVEISLYLRTENNTDMLLDRAAQEDLSDFCKKVTGKYFSSLAEYMRS